ncbi:hypothetical protein J437_LFUL011553 [Ladona fulva]|uniref:Uncharacterized protein n=1 Tax=Ladona fulva TaxID=123851 RepID=A0A8K0P0T3_LADFU|nr:hypothetical protein J437_LFUL011553 [Ladona fulva]
MTKGGANEMWKVVRAQGSAKTRTTGGLAVPAELLLEHFSVTPEGIVRGVRPLPQAGELPIFSFSRITVEDVEAAAKTSKSRTPGSDGIAPQALQKLVLTLQFLATGDLYTSVRYLFKFSKQAIRRKVPEILKTQEEWMKVAEEFHTKRNFPVCDGSLDGKHITLQCSIHSGSECINYKGFFHIVLFSWVGVNYEFLFVDGGCQRRISDGGIFYNSSKWSKSTEFSRGHSSKLKRKKVTICLEEAGVMTSESWRRRVYDMDSL